MNEHKDVLQSIRESYDRVADEYARHFVNELQHKPFDREQLNRFAAEVRGRGQVCDMGCGPGHIARYVHDAGTNVFGLDLSPRMLEEARQRHPDISFREGNMLGLDLPNGLLAGIVAFYAIVNIPMESLPLVFQEMVRVLQPEACCCSLFTRVRKPCTCRSCGAVLFPSTGSFFPGPKFDDVSKLPGSPSKKSSSDSLMPRKSNTRAGGPTFSLGSSGSEPRIGCR